MKDYLLDACRASGVAGYRLPTMRGGRLLPLAAALAVGVAGLGCGSSGGGGNDAGRDATVDPMDAEVTDTGVEDDADVTDSGGDDDDAGSGDGGGPCEPETDAEMCERVEAECGEVTDDDNCGTPRTVDCGALPGFGCDEPATCVLASEDGPATNTCMCSDGGDVCADVDCGTVTDDCGEAVDCGGCGDDEACEDNACVCEESRSDSEVCADEGAECDDVTDVCGDFVSCGSCGTDEACEDNACVCHESRSNADVCSDEGADCDTVTDVCGDTVPCGSCGTDERCRTSDNQCVCDDSRSSSEICDDELGSDECGTVTDVCGNTRSCGCPSGESCSSGTCVCVPSCAPDSCGSDGCGGTCTCSGGKTCTCSASGCFCVDSPM